MGLPYNGWSTLVRGGRDKYYYRARDTGVLPPATECLGCRAALPASCVPYHAEEYGPTLEDYWASCKPLCHRCHAILHARFATPNRWKRYLTQAATGLIDEVEYPTSGNIASLLSKYKARKDIDFVPMPDEAPRYLRDLPLSEYDGKTKVAMLRVLDKDGSTVDVADWLLYGADLSGLKAERADINVGPQRDALTRVPGFPQWYMPLYLNSGRKVWYRERRAASASEK